jgi:hypothetical protein
VGAEFEVPSKENPMDETARYLKRAILTWEVLRGVYNLAFLVQLECSSQLLKLAAQRPGFTDPCMVLIVLLGIANAVYSLAPLLEIYACVFHSWRIGRSRYALFAAGLLLSVGVLLFLHSVGVPFF